jgi:hypothetical protein
VTSSRFPIERVHASAACSDCGALLSPDERTNTCATRHNRCGPRLTTELRSVAACPSLSRNKCSAENQQGQNNYQDQQSLHAPPSITLVVIWKLHWQFWQTSFRYESAALLSAKTK